MIVAGFRRLATRLVAVVDHGGQPQDRAGRKGTIEAFFLIGPRNP